MGEAEALQGEGREEGGPGAGCVYVSPQQSAPFLIPAAPEQGAHGAPLATTIGPGGTFVLSQANQRMTALLMDSGTKKLSPSVHERRATSDQETLTPTWDPQGSQP